MIINKIIYKMLCYFILEKGLINISKNIKLLIIQIIIYSLYVITITIVYLFSDKPII